MHCTGNSCRSQMAEGWLRHLSGDRFNVVSAGTYPVGINPYAVTVVGEAGVDISHHVSERIDPNLYQHLTMITVCDRVQKTCPISPSPATMLHWNFDDPAKATGTYYQQLIIFRKTRDEKAHNIRCFVGSYSHN